MNHTYRLIWNRVLSMFVAVSECARTLGKCGGAKAIAGAAIAAAVVSGPAALAHTTSVGYEILPSNAIEIWYGTYHNTSFTEGSLSFVGNNGYSSTVGFTDLVKVKPAGLVDGTTNFFSNGTTLIGTPNNVIATWQGVTFANLLAGTYTFTYIPLARPTSDWQPTDNVIKTGSFVITAQALGNAGGAPSTIDTSQGAFNASALAPTGTLQFQGGTLTSDVDQATLAQDFTIDNNGGTIDQAGHTATLTGAIADATVGTPGSLTFSNSTAGGSVILAGANTYSGLTTVDAGATLALAGAGAISDSSGVVANGMLDVSAASGNAAVKTLSGSGTVVLGANSLILTAANGDFGGAIAGGGGLTVAGGQASLSGANAYTGATQVDSGATLALAGNGSVAASSGVVANGVLDVSAAAGNAALKTLSGNGTVVLGANSLVLTAASSDFGGAIAGGGGVRVAAGSETLSGANLYSGATQVDSGAVLNLAGNGSIAASSGVVNNGVLNLSAANRNAAITALSGNGAVALGANSLILTAANGDFGGAIAGGGGLTVAGGQASLSGANAYTGATQVDSDATLALAGNGSVAASSGVVANGVLDVSAAAGNAALKTLSGNGTVVLGANSLVLTAAGSDFAGAIAGSGGVTVAGGNASLSRANAYTGTTHVDSGATLALAGAGAISASSGVVANGVLDVSAAAGNAALKTLSGNGTVVLGANSLVLTAASSDFGGAIAGGGGVRVAAGSETLSGANLYSGATQVDSDAVLNLAGNGSIAASSGVVNNGVLNLSAANRNAAITALSGNGAVALGANSLILTAANGDFAGAISGGGGVTVAGGNASLSGANAYTGTTQVDSGATLALAGNGSVGASSGVLNNGTLTIASNAPAAVASLAGNGTVNLARQSLILTKAVDNFSGVIGGTGNLVVSGGVQQLSGANTFAGTVGAIDGGTLQVASNANLGVAGNALVLANGTLNTTGTLTMDRGLALSGTGTVQTGAGTTLTSNGAISGAGALGKTGAGTLVLAGDNSALTGGASIAGGTLKLASASGIGSGAIALQAGTLETGANMTLAQSIAVSAGTVISTDAGTTATLSGTISSRAGGDGCFTKSGAGTLNVTGSGSFGMGLCVAQGMLRANGLTGATFIGVNNGATLRGTGAVNAPITVSGTLAPGNSPGTLSTSGNVTMLAGSTYQEDINGTGAASGPGNYSRLLISGAGQFNAGGATLAPNLVNITGADTYTAYVPKVGDSFRIVTAAGGLVGRFAPLVQPAGLADGTSLRVFYNGDGSNSIDLRVLPTSYASYSNAHGGNTNGQRSGAVLDRVMTADQAGIATATQSALAYAVSHFAGSSVATVMQNLSGQVHGAMAAIAPLAGQAVQGTVTKQLDQAAPADVSARSALWAELAGNRAEWDADSHASGFVANRGQLTIGADAFRNDRNRVGVGFSHARANLDADNSSGTLRENMVFAYGAHQGQVFGFDAMAGAGRTSWETERANPLAGGVLSTGMDGRNVLASVGVSAPWQADGATFKPFVRVLWQRTERDAGSEGAELAALYLGRYSASGTRTTAGLSGNAKGGDIGQTPYTMQYSFGVGRDNGSLARTTVDSSLVGIVSTIVAPHASRSFVQAAVSGSVFHTTSTSSYYGVATELHGTRADVSVSGGLRYAF